MGSHYKCKEKSKDITSKHDQSVLPEMDSGYKSPEQGDISPELFQNQLADPTVQALFDEYYNGVS